MGLLSLGMMPPPPDSPGELFEREKSNDEKLKDYLSRINGEYKGNMVVVQNNDIFEGFKEINQKTRVQDYSIFFPFYKAGEEKYAIPWLLLWIIHEQETGASSHPYPEWSGYMGAMQRDPDYYDQDYVDEACRGWEFLKMLPQRYMKDKGSQTWDFEEIMFAAKKIREDARNILDSQKLNSDEEAVLTAQYSYCAPYYARQRIAAFKRAEDIFKREKQGMRQNMF